MKVTEQELLEKGFSQYDPFCFDYAKKCFEKEYELSTGEKYFISVKEYNALYKSGREVSPAHFEAFAKLYRKGSHEEMEVSFLFDDLDKVEKFIEQLFRCGLIESK